MKEVFNEHQPVMLDEVMKNLSVKSDGVYLDATFGRGGHAQAILRQLGPAGRLLAMDKDSEAVSYACQIFSHEKRFTIYHGSFAQLASFALAENVCGNIDGILMDLGVSSPQLDDPARGFSFMRAGKLDMRMDTTRGIDAATWVNETAEDEMANAFWQYGEERYSRRIARGIVNARGMKKISTTEELAEIIAKAHPAWQKGKHPATQCFQAIRIVINEELKDLELGLKQALKVLKVGGRLLVISFHSLEDRIVKRFMQQEEQGEEIPARLPIKHQDRPLHFKRINRAIKPSQKEIAVNVRARSAVLRIGEKLL